MSDSLFWLILYTKTQNAPQLLGARHQLLLFIDNSWQNWQGRVRVLWPKLERSTLIERKLYRFRYCFLKQKRESNMNEAIKVFWQPH